MVAAVPAEVMAQASGSVVDENAEWATVYKEFIRTKKQCGEPTDGISFDSLSKRIRAQVPELMQKHKARNIEFKVVIKGGKAILKAIPHT